MTETRTIVLSDVHGCPQLVDAVLAHARFEPGVDRLVFAGDFLDRGMRGGACLKALEAAGAEMLWGNHDVAVLLGWPIQPQNPSSLAFRDLLRERFEAGEWRLATSVDGVLVSHAGVSSAYAGEFAAAGYDAAALAARIDAEFRAEVEEQIDGRCDGDYDWLTVPRVFGDLGPLWFRPALLGPESLLPGLTQIAGHSVLEGADAEALRAAGLYGVDPGVSPFPELFGEPAWRYAVVRRGAVEVLSEDLVSAAS